MPKADLEGEFLRWVLDERLPMPEREYVFAPPRRWRFDFCWPDHLVAVEIQGIRWREPGGHQTGKGVLNDAEKTEAALRLGYAVYVVPGPWLIYGRKIVRRPEVMMTLRELLGRKDTINAIKTLKGGQ